MLTLTFIWATYKILFSQSSNYNLNRAILISTPVLPIIMYAIGSYSFSQFAPTTFAGETIQTVTINIQNSMMVSQLTFWDGILLLYALGAVIMLIITIRNIRNTILKVNSFKYENNIEGVNISYSENKETFSFFNKIHICNDLKQNDTVLEHELVHVRQKHSLDILLYAIYKILFWFHPLIYLLDREIKLTHEYIADDIVSENSNKATYANKLLNIYFGTGSIQFINQFNNQKFIKMRLKMLSKKEKKSQLWRYVALPVVLAALTLSVSSFVTSESFYMSSATIESDPIYDSVDVMPEYKGGNQALFAFIGSNVKYPKQSANEGIQGKCLVEFTISKTGDVKDAKIKQGVNGEIDAESLRVINAMPKWTPGKKDGQNVNVKMILPIAYKLDL